MATIPTELRNAIRDKNLVVFVGAGLSYDLRNEAGELLLGWKNMVEQLLDKLDSQGHDVQHIKAMASTDKYDPIYLLDMIEKDLDLPKDEIVNFVSEFYTLAEDNDLSLHRNIYRLTNKIITTNYDRAFETAINDLDDRVVHTGRNMKLSTLHRPNELSLFKLHGCISDSDKMVILPSSYSALYSEDNEESEHILFYLKNMIVDKHILFIGYGMDDFQLNNIFAIVDRLLGKYNRQKHFILTKESLDKKLDFLTPIEITDYSEINSFIEELVEFTNEVDKKKSDVTLRLELHLEEAHKTLEKGCPQSFNNIDERNFRVSFRLFCYGLECHIAGQYKEAIKFYKLVVDADPDFYKAYTNMGIAYAHLGDYHVAKECYEKSTTIKPNAHDTLYNMGLTYAYLGDYRSAKTCYEKALHIKLDDHEVLNNMGLAQFRLGDYRSALDCFKKAFKLNSESHEALSNKGLTHFHLGDYRTSIKYYSRVLVMKPDEHEAYISIGLAYYFLKRYNKATENYKKALEIKPDDKALLANLGLLCLVTGDLAQGMIYQKKAIEFGDLDYSNKNMGHLYFAQKMRGKALEHYKEALKNFSSKELFFKSMDVEYQHLVRFGVSQIEYSKILDELKSFSDRDFKDNIQSQMLFDI